jgi:starch phosphorylase
MMHVDEQIGTHWRRDLFELGKLRDLRDDPSFIHAFHEAKRQNKLRLIQRLQQHTKMTFDPDALFDLQVKRIHEYKRQLLNVLHVIVRYNQIRANPERDWVPRVVMFAGKAASAYRMAKTIIKLIGDVSKAVNEDPIIGDKLKVLFVPNYGVSVAELIIPAADLSEQISTAGMEASGTGNMKFALNGALTIGTYDGANIEIHDNVGDDNIMIFGLSAAEVAQRRRDGNNPKANIAASPALEATLQAVRNGVFSPDEPGRYAQLVDDLTNSDYFMVTADFAAYEAMQRRVDESYQNSSDWARRALLNTARMGWFSADRAIREYATEIWGATLETEAETRQEAAG